MMPFARTAALSLAALGTAQFSGPTVDAAGGVYTLPSGGSFELLGVCRIDPDATECWKADGTRDADLTKRVRAYFDRRNSQDIEFRPGHKWRYAVLRRPPNRYAYFSSDKSKSIFSTDDPTPTEVVSWGRYTVDPAVKTFDATITIANAKPLPAYDLPKTPGARTEIRGVRFELGDLKATEYGFRVNPFAYGGYPPVNRPKQRPRGWEVLKAQAEQSDFLMDFSLQPIGQDGQPIRYVGSDGVPVTETAYLQAMAEGTPPGQRAVENGYGPAVVQPTSAGYYLPSVPMRYQTNVNPDHIKAIRILPTERQPVRFTGLAADPVP